MCGRIHLTFSVFVIASLIALELVCVNAGNSNGRFKYIKKPVSKYKVKDNDNATDKTNQTKEENENGESAPLVEEEPGENGEPAPQEGAEEQPGQPSAPQGAPEEPGHGDSNNKDSVDDNKLEGPENPAADEINPASPSEEGEGIGAETPSAGDANTEDDTRKNNDYGGQNNPEQGIPNDMTSSTSSYPSEGEGKDRVGTTRRQFQYTNELGEPVFHFTPTTRIIRFRRTSTTLINGKRYEIQNRKRGWNRQTILSTED